MKILKTCLSQSWGGLEMYTLQTVKQLLKRNIDAELLCYPNSQIHKEALKSGIKVHASYFKNYFHPSETFAISKLIKQSKYDIIHCGASKDLWLITPALFISSEKTPLLLSKHMGSYIVKKDLLHKCIYKRVTAALAISNVIAKNLVDTTPLPKEKIILLHNGIETSVFDPAKTDHQKVRNEFSINDDELLIGMIARFSPGKGHEEFLHAAKILLNKKHKLQFIIVGAPSKGEDLYAEKIKSLANKLGISNKIIFAGFRKDTPEVLAAMDIFVFPSHAEAFGIALAEALSMGKPSVCSNSDGVLDIAVDGVTSYLFEKQNWNDLADKIEMLVISPAKRNELGITSRKRAVEVFDIEVFTDKLISIYKQTLN
jgi:glycosyltransferase involved in cell wall biosynthesis